MEYSKKKCKKCFGGLIYDKGIEIYEYENKGTGFSFANYNAHEMLGIVNYAKDVYYNHKREWNKIVDRGMKMDFSWNNSARKYEELYNSL